MSRRFVWELIAMDRCVRIVTVIVRESQKLRQLIRFFPHAQLAVCLSRTSP